MPSLPRHPCDVENCNSDRFWADAYGNFFCREHRPPKIRALVRQDFEIWWSESGNLVFVSLENSDSLRAAGKTLAPDDSGAGGAASPSSPQAGAGLAGADPSHEPRPIRDLAPELAADIAATFPAGSPPGAHRCPTCGYWRAWQPMRGDARCYRCRPPRAFVDFLKRSLRAYRRRNAAEQAREIEWLIFAMTAEILAARKFQATGDGMAAA